MRSEPQSLWSSAAVAANGQGFGVMISKRLWQSGVSSVKEPKSYIFNGAWMYKFSGYRARERHMFLRCCLCSICLWQDYWIGWWVCITWSGNSSFGSCLSYLSPNLVCWMHMSSPNKQPGHSYGKICHPLFPKAHKIFPKERSLWEYQMLSSDEQQAACCWSLMSTSTFNTTETGGGHVGFTVVFGMSATAPGGILVAYSTLCLYCGCLLVEVCHSQPGEFLPFEAEGSMAACFYNATFV